MSNEFSRRDVLRTIGISLSLTATGADVVTAEAAQHVHGMVREAKAAKGPYKPRLLNAHEYATLQKLADLIIPADEKSKGALDAGAAEFIDFLCTANDELAAIYTGGIGWLDREMTRRHGALFINAKPDQQIALLDLIAYVKNESAELNPGIRFFTWVRNMTADAFYTSKIGMDDLGYMGNGAMSQFTVPAEAIQYAVKRSGLT
jgi:hypothetical protein